MGKAADDTDTRESARAPACYCRYGSRMPPAKDDAGAA